MEKKRFSFKNMSVYELCVMAMFVAITLVLSIVSGYMRIGPAIKIDIKFIPVFLCGAIFGPVASMAVGAVADIMSWAVNPTGPWLWQLTVIEAINGAIFGILLFYKKESSIGKSYTIRIVFCAFSQFLINLFIRTWVMIYVGILPQSFAISLITRLAGCGANLIIKVVILILIQRFIPRIAKIIRK